mmetsp:Transcript_24682/g.48560  ORF Transcript_24682/g.48560 Transcript_24682/m.48560 type:complete len:220 (-) Transcript_24682:1124-1783(-)
MSLSDRAFKLIGPFPGANPDFHSDVSYVVRVYVVLGAADCQVQIENLVPPASGHKNYFSRFLNDLNHAFIVLYEGFFFEMPLQRLRRRVVVSVVIVMAFDARRDYPRRTQSPQLMACEQGVPSRSLPRVSVECSTSPSRSNDKPLVRRSTFLDVSEKVLSEKVGHLVVLQKLRVVIKSIVIEQVIWTIFPLIFSITDKIADRHFETAPRAEHTIPKFFS